MKKLPSPEKTASFLMGVLLLALLASVCVLLRRGPFARPPARGLTAEIYRDGQLIRSIPLDTLTETISFTVTGTDGSYNTIQAGPDGVRVTQASCPEKICIRQGPISDSLLPITCLPNHLVIRLTSERESDAAGGMDAVTY